MLRKRYAITSAILVLVGSSLVDAEELRVWKSQSGDYEVAAKFVSTSDQLVKLRTEEGREIEIELAKLSTVDQEFIAEAMVAKEAEKEIRRTLLRFYRAVQREPDGIRGFLTEAGQATFDGNRNFFEKLRGPDQNHRIGIGKIKVDGDRAVAEYRLRLEGKSYRMKMPFLQDEDRWCALAIVGPNPDGHGENMMDFEQGTSASGVEDGVALVASFQPANSGDGTTEAATVTVSKD